MGVAQARAVWIASEQRVVVEAAIKSVVVAAIESHGLTGAAVWLATEGAAVLLAKIEAVTVQPVSVEAGSIDVLDRR